MIGLPLPTTPPQFHPPLHLSYICWVKKLMFTYTETHSANWYSRKRQNATTKIFFFPSSFDWERGKTYKPLTERNQNAAHQAKPHSALAPTHERPLASRLRSSGVQLQLQLQLQLFATDVCGERKNRIFKPHGRCEST